MTEDPDMPELGSKTTNNVVLFHGNCQDSFMCAVLARLAFKQNCVFKACSYDEAFDEAFDESTLPLYSMAHVYILDFSYPVNVLLKISGYASSLTVLDHHKTFAETIKRNPDVAFTYRPIANTEFVYEPNSCGARMTSDFLCSSGYDLSECPQMLINYVEDRDLWKWQLPYSHEINEYFSTVPRTFALWKTLMRQFQDQRDVMVTVGTNLLCQTELHVTRLASAAFPYELCGHKVWVCNTQSFQSEVGHKICELFPDAKFAAMYYDKDATTRMWSLRGRATDDFDCSEVAKKFGGGGHKKACGFKTSIENDPIVRAAANTLMNRGQLD